MNDIGKLEPVLLVEKLGIGLWIAKRRSEIANTQTNEGQRKKPKV